MQHKIFPIVSLLCINGYIVFLVYILDSSSQPVSGREHCQVKYEFPVSYLESVTDRQNEEFSKVPLQDGSSWVPL